MLIARSYRPTTLESERHSRVLPFSSALIWASGDAAAEHAGVPGRECRLPRYASNYADD